MRIDKAALPWTLLALAWLPDDDALQAREQLRGLMSQFAFASCTPFVRERSGLLFRAASTQAPDDDLIDRIELLLGLRQADVLRYADRRQGQRRAVRLARNGQDASQLEGFVLAGDTSAENWIKTLLQDELPAQSYGRLLLLPGAHPPVTVSTRGQQVCTCLNVTDLAISDELTRCQGGEDERLAQLQGRLRCGTQCGSCLPTLKRMVRVSRPAPALSS